MTSPHFGDPEGCYARVIADSVNDRGDRLTSFEVQAHRFILAEINTHCTLSRNSASSRAIPFKKQYDRVVKNPAIPVSFPEEQRGMQGGAELEAGRRELAVDEWKVARLSAAEHARVLNELGAHKSVANRLLEPFQWHRILVSGVAWENFFRQRAHPAAQPEFRALAELMNEARLKSVPEKLEEGWWHCPYLDGDTIADVTSYYPPEQAEEVLVRVSVARCARTSYMTQAGNRDYHEDLALFKRLAEGDPPHMSPFEHAATPAGWNVHRVNVRDPASGKLLTPQLELPRVGKFIRFLQYRHLHEAREGHVSFE